MEAKERRESFCTLLLPLALVADVQGNYSRSKLVLKNQSGGLFQPFSGFSIVSSQYSFKNQLVIVVFELAR